MSVQYPDQYYRAMLIKKPDTLFAPTHYVVPSESMYKVH